MSIAGAVAQWNDGKHPWKARAILKALSEDDDDELFDFGKLLNKAMEEERKQHRMEVARLRDLLDDAQLQLDYHKARAASLEQELDRERELVQLKLDECSRRHAEKIDEVQQKCVTLRRQLEEANKSRSVEITELTNECISLRERLDEALHEHCVQVSELERDRASQALLINSLLAGNLHPLTDERANDSEAGVEGLPWECSSLWEQLAVERMADQQESETCFGTMREGSQACIYYHLEDVDDERLCGGSDAVKSDSTRASLEVSLDECLEPQKVSLDEMHQASHAHADHHLEDADYSINRLVGSQGQVGDTMLWYRSDSDELEPNVASLHGPLVDDSIASQGQVDETILYGRSDSDDLERNGASLQAPFVDVSINRQGGSQEQVYDTILCGRSESDELEPTRASLQVPLVDDSINSQGGSQGQVDETILHGRSESDELEPERASLQVPVNVSLETQVASFDKMQRECSQLEMRDSEATSVRVNEAEDLSCENKEVMSNLSNMSETCVEDVAAPNDSETMAQTCLVEKDATCTENVRVKQVTIVEDSASNDVAKLKEECLNLRKKLASQSETRRKRFSQMLELQREREELRQQMPASTASHWTAVVDWFWED
eukprot:TRINITY_DN8349_c0_g1_i4.p1 TRINITY_DN8349_c0_g1~~TRINITY_DN8349_c0_g1_i4.p1  ORF type:complete len:622 (+),score=102.32 TRINITY_DN8349_c0_g1_i4:33-1868(+)